MKCNANVLVLRLQSISDTPDSGNAGSVILQLTM
jgi:hypothetical protein